ncbi:hypothetical protein [Streptomyces erythrochromogenes]|nr:hypothetical protein OG489_37810 [Streptomyces erythrochromogenes]
MLTQRVVHTLGRTRPTTREQALDVLRPPQVETRSICPAAQELGITAP